MSSSSLESKRRKKKPSDVFSSLSFFTLFSLFCRRLLGLWSLPRAQRPGRRAKYAACGIALGLCCCGSGIWGPRPLLLRLRCRRARFGCCCCCCRCRRRCCCGSRSRLIAAPSFGRPRSPCRDFPPRRRHHPCRRGGAHRLVRDEETHAVQRQDERRRGRKGKF